jgi:uncharacterized protein (TIGR02996 family)
VEREDQVALDSQPHRREDDPSQSVAQQWDKLRRDAARRAVLFEARMVDEPALMQAILANPTDDAPRLVYADWLEERGDPRAELLRIQTAMMTMPRKDQQQARFRKRLKELRSTLDAESLAWLNTLRYRTTFAALARPLTPRDGVPEERIAEEERRLGARLPRALRDYYLVAGRCDRLNKAHDRLLPPKRWELASGKIAFLVENQGVALAGVKANDPAGDDPPVYWGYLDDDKPQWRKHQDRCSEFLVINLYQQAVMGGMKHLGQADITPENLAQIEETWPFIGEGYVDAFGKDGQAVCVMGRAEVYVGGRGRKDFAAIVAAFSGMGVTIEER